ncbi:MAG: caspase family protein [Hyphomicrobiales bacterium]
MKLPRDARQSAWVIGCRLLTAILFTLCLSSSSDAQDDAPLKGVALVIGESSYKQLPALGNPANDARAIKELLDELGFDTRDVVDRDAKKLRRDLDRFLEDAEGADIALVYYSGHGIEAGGENWLVPNDADVSSLAKADESLIAVSDILQRLQETVPLSIILLDACRSNPFPRDGVLKSRNAAAPLPVASGGLGVPTRGVLIEESASSKAGSGTVLGFAADPGQVALDGPEDGNSPYTAAILKHLGATGFDFGDVMTLVAEEVYVETQGRQRPWTNQNLRQFLYFGVAAKEKEDGDEASIRGERRKLLLTIAATPAETKGLVERLARHDDVPLGALFGMLKVLGVEGNDDPEETEKRLVAGTEKLKNLLAERQALHLSDPELQRLSELADHAVAEGAITTALDLHKQVKTRIASLSETVDTAEAALKARRLEFAQAFAKSAETSVIAFDFRAAAEDYRSAFEQAQKWDDALAIGYKIGEGNALKSFGDYSGDNAVLAQAISALKEAADLAQRSSRSDDWALAQNDIGTAYYLLGRRDGSDQHLESAIAAYEAALTIRQRTANAENWATTTENLGVALVALSVHSGNRDDLQRAIAILQAARDARTRDADPMAWASVEGNLAAALLQLGVREAGVTTLEQAVASLQAAIDTWPRERAPLQWASLQNNLGIALRSLGKRQPGTAAFEQAVKAYEAAFGERTRERVPLLWAATQNNLGVALQNLGERQEGGEAYRKAIAAHEAALSELTRERAPLDWATTQTNIGNALLALGEREDDTLIISRALAAYEAALLELTREHVPLLWASAQNSRASAFRALGRREQGTENLSKAVDAYRLALQETTKSRSPLDWAKTEDNLGMTLFELGSRTRDKAQLLEGKQAVEEAWNVLRSAGYKQYDDYFSKSVARFDRAIAALK